jgi:ubiquinone/menaquinone biosynthesis C-methylase UbiE
VESDRNSEVERTADPARRQFGAVATAYATSPVHAAGPDLRLLVETANLSGHESVLDLGCGAGHTALALAPHAASVVAVDVTPEMIEVAQQLTAARGITNISFRLGDATALPFDADSFDLVTSRYSAHHYSDPTKAIAEVARVLRHGGRFLLVDTVAPEDPALDTFFNAAELLRDGSHIRNCRVSEWERIMRDAGLSPSVIMRSTLELDGRSWVERSQTSAPMVTSIRNLFSNANPAVRKAFALRDGDEWGWDIPIALIGGVHA